MPSFWPALDRMKQITWPENAETDLDAIMDYIARSDAMAAIGMREEIESQVERLRTFLRSGQNASSIQDCVGLVSG